jgi:hypothetical protein
MGAAPMTMEQLLASALAVTWGGLGVSFAIGRWARRQETASEIPLYRIEQLEKRMETVVLRTEWEATDRQLDRAGKKMSDLANEVQVLPERMREQFVLRAEWDLTERRRVT